MDVTTWFQRWMDRHPLREPSIPDPSQYTAEVMARIKALEQPASAPATHRPLFWLRPALLVATATAVIILVAGRMTPQQQVAQESQDTPLRLATEPAEAPSMAEPPPAHVQPTRPLMLAESASEDGKWLSQILELLDTVDEDLPDDLFDDWSDEEWLDELELLDDEEFFADG